MVPPKAREAYIKDSWSAVLSGIMIGLAYPFFAVIARKKLGATDIQIGILSMAPVMGNLVSFFGAQMMEGRRKMPFAYWAWVAGRVLLIALIFKINAPVYVVIITLYFLITSISGPAYSDLVREMYPEGDRGRVMAYVRIWMWLITIIVTLAAGWLLDRGKTSFHVLFPIAGVFGVISAWVYAKIPTKDAHGDRSASFAQFVRSCISILYEDKAYRWFCVGIFIYGFANFMATPIYALYEMDVLHALEGRQSYYYCATSIATMIAYLYWGGHVDRKRPEWTVVGLEMAWILIPLSYVIAHVWWTLMPAKVLWGALNAGVDLAYLSGVIYFAPRSKLMQYQAIFAFLMGLRGVTAPFLGTALKQSGLLSMQQIFIMAAAMIFIAVGVQVVGAKKYGPLKDSASR